MTVAMDAPIRVVPALVRLGKTTYVGVLPDLGKHSKVLDGVEKQYQEGGLTEGELRVLFGVFLSAAKAST